MEIAAGIWVIVGLMVLAVVLLMSLMASLYRKAGPHEALVCYGFRGTRVVKGHGTVIFPMIETFRQLSLELMSFDVAPVQDLYTKQGVAVSVEAVAQIKVKSDPLSIQTASEQFLTKSADQRENLIRLVMEGHLRGIIGQLTVEQIVKEPEMVAERMRSTCADDMNKMGLATRPSSAPRRCARRPLPRHKPIRNACWPKRSRKPSRPKRSATSR